MTCQRIGNAIVCTRGQRRPPCETPGCVRHGTKLCDWPLRGELAGKTCDRRMCAEHATMIARDVDYCRVHAQSYRAAQATGREPMVEIDDVHPSEQQASLFGESAGGA